MTTRAARKKHPDSLSTNRRRRIRFSAETNTLAWLTVVTDAPEDNPAAAPQTERMVGLVVDEAHDSCGMIMRPSPHLRVGVKCLIELGSFEPIIGSITRVRPLDTDVVRVGLVMDTEPVPVGG